MDEASLPPSHQYYTTNNFGTQYHIVPTGECRILIRLRPCILWELDDDGSSSSFLYVRRACKASLAKTTTTVGKGLARNSTCSSRSLHTRTTLPSRQAVPPPLTQGRLSFANVTHRKNRRPRRSALPHYAYIILQIILVHSIT